jgi:hypothetical protein
MQSLMGQAQLLPGNERKPVRWRTKKAVKRQRVDVVEVMEAVAGNY